MDLLILAILIAAGTFMLNAKEQRKRIVLLGRHLANYQIEQLMQALTDGYLRALGESTDERRSQIWSLLGTTESQLSEQFDLFAAVFAKVDKAHTHVSRLALPIPFAEKIFSGRTFEMRRVLSIHARDIAHVVHNTDHLSPKERAYMMMAELFLMQHSCHWFCKSKAVATARMLAHHQTPHGQLIASVSAQTRKAYLALIGGGWTAAAPAISAPAVWLGRTPAVRADPPDAGCRPSAALAAHRHRPARGSGPHWGCRSPAGQPLAMGGAPDHVQHAAVGHDQHRLARMLLRDAAHGAHHAGVELARGLAAGHAGVGIEAQPSGPGVGVRGLDVVHPHTVDHAKVLLAQAAVG